MYDLIILGGGPGGYSAALHAVKNGKKVLLVEKEELGGVCLNRGCIPAKSLLNSAKLYKQTRNSSSFGVDVADASFNFNQAYIWKEKVVGELKENLIKLLKLKKVDVVKGEGIISGSNSVMVGNELFPCRYILIATGSKPAIPSIPGIENCITSREVLKLKQKPESVTIIGGGVIGVEFASFFSSIGVEVNLVEKEKRILPGIEKRISGILEKSLNVNLYLDSEIKNIEKNRLVLEASNNVHILESDIILNATGRNPNCEQFNGLGIVEENKIAVNDRMETEIPGIYAAGDVTGRSLLAHSAVYMGETAVENMFGGDMSVEFGSVPSVVYSDPEVSSVGQTSDRLKAAGIPFKKSSFKLDLNGRYLGENGHDKSLCIVFSHKETDVILGVHMVGKGVSEIISNAVIALSNSYTTERFTDTIFPHPTVSEVLKESMLFMN